MHSLKSFSKLLQARNYSARTIWCAVILIAVIPALAHIFWPICIVVFIACAIFTPLPSVFQSVFGRLFASLMVTYGLLQLVALVQLFVFPSSYFMLASVLFALVSCAFLVLFGTAPPKNLKVIRAIDVFVLVAGAVFLITFYPVVVPASAADHAVAEAGVQIIDSVNHWNILSELTVYQNLARDYSQGYYPAGFHYATAFIEVAFKANPSQHAWLTNAKIYFAQYMFFGLVLLGSIIYFSYSLLERIHPKARNHVWMYGAVAASAALSSIILHLVLFVSEGFLNYYYVCATILIAMCFLIEGGALFNREEFRRRPILRVYVLDMYLLLSLGASLSWPLLTPAVLLTAVLAVKYPPWREWYGAVRSNLVVCLSFAALVFAHLLTVYAQVKYLPSSGSHVNLSGALSNYNVALLIIGTGIISWAIFTNQAKCSRLFTVLFAPFLLLIALLMLYQYFTLGEASYYLIKADMIVQMFTVALLSVNAVVLAQQGTDMPAFLRFSWPILAVVTVVITTIGTMPQPLSEVRSIYRGAAGVGKPPFLDSDSTIIAHLGGQNKINYLNLTILHYNPQNHYYFAQIEPGMWASAMGTDYTKEVTGAGITRAEANLQCSVQQQGLLIQGVSSNAMQQNLVNAVRDCARGAHAAGVKYYIVTDPGSVVALKAQFGSTVQVVSS